ncbi:MAG: hypothetical protein KBA81_03295 [Rhabdochlamydiaceae bacterium]|nr:hypothetical protein [Rhabdochlamydiaceae bacterium]
MSVQFNNCNISKKKEPCGICREPLDKNLVSHEMAHKVQHIFHESCIAEWFKVRPACALCNATVFEIKGVPISDYLALKNAVSSGDLYRILELINRPNPKLRELALAAIPDGARVEAIRMAGLQENLDLVRDLSKNFPLTQEQCELATESFNSDFAKRYVLNALENNEKIIFSDNLLNEIFQSSYSDSIPPITGELMTKIAHLCAKESYDLFFVHTVDPKGVFYGLRNEFKQEIKAGSFLTRWKEVPQATTAIIKQLLSNIDKGRFYSCDAMIDILFKSDFINASEKGPDGTTPVDLLVEWLKNKTPSTCTQCIYMCLIKLLAAPSAQEIDTAKLDKQIMDMPAKLFLEVIDREEFFTILPITKTVVKIALDELMSGSRTAISQLLSSTTITPERKAKIRNKIINELKNDDHFKSKITSVLDKPSPVQRTSHEDVFENITDLIVNQ